MGHRNVLKETKEGGWAPTQEVMRASTAVLFKSWEVERKSSKKV